MLTSVLCEQPSDATLTCAPEGKPDVLQEVSTLARCQSQNITQYHASVLKPGTSELLIVMELMAASVADLVPLRLLQLSSSCRSLMLLLRVRCNTHFTYCYQGLGIAKSVIA